MTKNNDILTLADLSTKANQYGNLVLCDIAHHEDLMAFYEKGINANFYTIGLVLKGSGHMIQGSQDYPLQQNSFYVIKPFSGLRTADFSEDIEIAILDIDPDYYERIIQLSPDSVLDQAEDPDGPCYSGFLLEPVRAKRLLEYYIQVRDTIAHDHRYKSEMIRHLILVFHLIISELEANVVEKPHDIRHKENIYKTFLFSARKNFRKQRQIKFYADEQNITTTYLSRIIKEISGNTVYTYLSTLLYNEICKQLKDSSVTITEISYQLNFNDPSAMTNFFKQKSGMSPATYRKVNVIH